MVINFVERRADTMEVLSNFPVSLKYKIWQMGNCLEDEYESLMHLTFQIITKFIMRRKYRILQISYQSKVAWVFVCVALWLEMLWHLPSCYQKWHFAFLQDPVISGKIYITHLEVLHHVFFFKKHVEWFNALTMLGEIAMHQLNRRAYYSRLAPLFVNLKQSQIVDFSLKT